MNPEIKITKQPINTYFDNNDLDFLKDTEQASIFKVNLLEKELILELTVVWRESGFKVVSFDHLLLNAIDLIGGYVVFNKKTGKINKIKDIKEKTITINQELIDCINNNDIKSMELLFKSILDDYQIKIKKINSNSFGLFYISDFDIIDNNKKTEIINLVSNQCEKIIKEKQIKF